MKPVESMHLQSLKAAVEALQNKQIHGLVTAPIHKKNIQSEEFNYSGHTPYLKDAFGVNDVVMFMVATNIRVGLVTEHVPVTELAGHITKEAIIKQTAHYEQQSYKRFRYR